MFVAGMGGLTRASTGRHYWIFLIFTIIHFLDSGRQDELVGNSEFSGLAREFSLDFALCSFAIHKVKEKMRF